MVRKTLVLGLIAIVGAVEYTLDVDYKKMPDTAVNVYCAQTHFGVPRALTRLTPEASIDNNNLPIPDPPGDQRCRSKKKNRYGPYNRRAPCTKGYCVYKIAFHGLDPAKVSCDEYPPASTLEGGGLDKSGMRAAQRCVTQEESDVQTKLFTPFFNDIDTVSAYPTVIFNPINIPENLDCNTLLDDIILSTEVPMRPMTLDPPNPPLP